MSHDFDSEIYGDNDQANLSHTVVEDNDEEEQDFPRGSRQVRIGPSRKLLNEMRLGDGETDAELQARFREQHGSGLANTRIADRESEYHQRRMKRARDVFQEDSKQDSASMAASSVKQSAPQFTDEAICLHGCHGAV